MGSIPIAPALHFKAGESEPPVAQGNQPVRKFRIGYVTVTVWENEKYFNVTLSKAYKEGDDWKDTGSLGAGDLLNAAKALQRAEEYIHENSQVPYAD